MPCNKSATETCLFTSIKVREPPVLQARSDIVTSCSRRKRLSSSAENTRLAVISLVNEAGATFVSASCCAMIWPLSISITIHAFASTVGAIPLEKLKTVGVFALVTAIPAELTLGAELVVAAPAAPLTLVCVAACSAGADLLPDTAK